MNSSHRLLQVLHHTAAQNTSKNGLVGLVLEPLFESVSNVCTEETMSKLLTASLQFHESKAYLIPLFARRGHL